MSFQQTILTAVVAVTFASVVGGVYVYRLVAAVKRHMADLVLKRRSEAEVGIVAQVNSREARTMPARVRIQMLANWIREYDEKMLQPQKTKIGKMLDRLDGLDKAGRRLNFKRSLVVDSLRRSMEFLRDRGVGTVSTGTQTEFYSDGQDPKNGEIGKLAAKKTTKVVIVEPYMNYIAAWKEFNRTDTDSKISRFFEYITMFFKLIWTIITWIFDNNELVLTVLRNMTEKVVGWFGKIFKFTTTVNQVENETQLDFEIANGVSDLLGFQPSS